MLEVFRVVISKFPTCWKLFYFPPSLVKYLLSNFFQQVPNRINTSAHSFPCLHCDLIEFLAWCIYMFRSQKSVPVFETLIDKKFRGDRRRSLSFSMDDPDCFPQDMSCIGAECFPVRKRGGHGNASDTESSSKKQPVRFSSPLHQRKKNVESVYNFTPNSSQELDPSLMKKLEKDVFVQSKESEALLHGSASKTSGVSSHCSKEVRFGVGQLRAIDNGGSTGPGRNELFSQGPLHAAWNNMQDTYTEVKFCNSVRLYHCDHMTNLWIWTIDISRNSLYCWLWWILHDSSLQKVD